MPNLSIVYERLMHGQICLYFHTIFSKFQCGFWKVFNAQHCLLAVVENGETLDEGGEIEAVLTDLSFLRHLTALSIDQNLLIAKLKEKQYIYIYIYIHT